MIAAASTDEKLDVCRQRGADDTINYAADDLKERAKQLTDGKGVDVVFDCVGGETAEQALRAIAWEGRFLVVGFTSGIPSIPLNLVLLKSCQIVGVFYGAMTVREPARNAAIGEQLIDWSHPACCSRTCPPAIRSNGRGRRCGRCWIGRLSARSSSRRSA